MSEQKMREILKKILVWDDGNLPGDILDEAREALAQQPAAVVELTDAVHALKAILGGTSWSDIRPEAFEMARKVILAYEANQEKGHAE